MPQIGWFELLIIVVIAILVIGPKDFPIVLNKIGSWIGSIKSFFSNIENTVQKATNLDDDEVIDVKIFSKNEIRKLMNRNKLRDMKTYVAIDRYFKLLT